MANPFTNDELAAIRRIDGMIAQFRASVSPVATLSLVHTFLTVAQNEGSNLTTIATKMHSSVPTVSRNILDLGDRNRKKKEGHKLIKSTQNPMNMRENMYELTPKGRLILNEIIKKLEA